MASRHRPPLDAEAIRKLLEVARSVPDAVAGPHLTDEDIVGYEGGYLNTDDAGRVERHLASCEECSAEMSEFMDAMEPWSGTEGERRVKALQGELRRNWPGAEAGPPGVPVPMDRAPKTKRMQWAGIAAAVAIASLAVNGYMALRLWHASDDRNATRRAVAQRDQRISDLESTLRRLEAGSDTASVSSSMVRFALAARRGPGSRNRGSELQELRVPPSAALVKLEAEFDAKWEYGRYEVVINNVDHGSVWSSADLAAERRDGRRVIVITVPASVLPSGDYTVVVSGVRPSGERVEIQDYSFSVAR